MAKETEQRKGFKLEVPLDASGVEDFKPDMQVRVLAVDRSGKKYSKVTKLDDRGKGVAAFEFANNPGKVRVVIGPESASDDELLNLQTITVQVPGNRVTDAVVKLNPVIISPYYWWWWHWWCRTFTISGRVLCPDGSPVPGATVCAYDVDKIWIWSSKQLVKCATTDATGSFSMTFKWCCGWWPWWWWTMRYWQLEPRLVELISPQLQRVPKLGGLQAQAQPDFRMFERLLGEEGTSINLSDTKEAVGRLDDIRTSLVKRLPASVELERLQIWPWYPFWPWWDCTPDIIFKVTQPCAGVEKVIVDENVFQTRANIPQNLNVTLIASDACCIPPDDTPEGNCIVISTACDTLLANIGGNPGAPASPIGFASPGAVSDSGDRPFALNVPISGIFGDTANVDYYEFEWSNNAAGPWNPMPPAAAGGFTRWYWENVPPATAGPEDWHPVNFNFSMISGRNVVESREHFEANNAPLNWGLTRFWVYNRDLLMNWLTENNFADGRYYMRVQGWDLVAPETLGNPRVLPLCGTEDENYVVLRVDNRLNPDPGHVPPATPTHPCGSGTIHTCTLEPDTDFLSVKLIRGGTEIDIAACGNEHVHHGDILRVDFIADDPNNHLSYYSLQAIYAENLAVDLLALGGTLTPLGGAPVPAAAQVGPNYGSAVYGPGSTALSQGAPSPIWRGGAIRLEVSAALAFPETCCYQLELIAHKRTIVGCDYSLWGHANKSTYALGITV